MNHLVLNIGLLLLGGLFLWLLAYSFFLIMFPKKSEQKKKAQKLDISKKRFQH